MSSKILTEVVFVGSGAGSSVKIALFCLLARPRKLFRLPPWLWFPRLMGLSPPFRLTLLSRAILAVLDWSCEVLNSFWTVSQMKHFKALLHLWSDCWVVSNSCIGFRSQRLTTFWTSFLGPGYDVKSFHTFQIAELTLAAFINVLVQL